MNTNALGKAITEDRHRKVSRQYLQQVKRRLAGLCRRCPSPRTGYEFCEVHRIKDRDRRRTKYACRKNGGAT